MAAYRIVLDPARSETAVGRLLDAWPAGALIDRDGDGVQLTFLDADAERLREVAGDALLSIEPVLPPPRTPAPPALAAQRLDPQRATRPFHGQVATRRDGGLTVSATKLVREGFRTRMLLVPGRLRFEVELHDGDVHACVSEAAAGVALTLTVTRAEDASWVVARADIATT